MVYHFDDFYESCSRSCIVNGQGGISIARQRKRTAGMKMNVVKSKRFLNVPLSCGFDLLGSEGSDISSVGAHHESATRSKRRFVQVSTGRKRF